MKVTDRDLHTVYVLRDFFYIYKDIVKHGFNADLLMRDSTDLIWRIEEHICNEKKRKEEK